MLIGIVAAGLGAFGIVTLLSHQAAKKPAEKSALRLEMEREDQEAQALKEAKFTGVITNLQAKAAALVAQGRYSAALTVFSAYRGPLSRETKEERDRLAAEFQTKYSAELNAKPTLPPPPAGGSTPPSAPPAGAAPAAPAETPAAPPPPPEDNREIEIF